MGYGTPTLTSKCTGSGRIERRDQYTAKRNSAKNMIMAATRHSEKEWLAELTGWAPTNEQERLEVMTLESETEEEWHPSPETNRTLSESGSDSWTLLDSQELAANSTEQPSLPKEYQEFQELFEQPRTNKLPKHGPHDHTIPIQEGRKVACKRIYPMSEKESQVLKEYIKDRLEKKQIRPSKSPAGHGVLFVPKKGGGTTTMHRLPTIE